MTGVVERLRVRGLAAKVHDDSFMNETLYDFTVGT